MRVSDCKCALSARQMLNKGLFLIAKIMPKVSLAMGSMSSG